ncbi:hypothetical protein EMIT019CA3_10327 [Bacillus pseudomycoides]|nr:hypothetical protein [Bacillus pseudomycoides]MCR8857705.1 hypothetical protein [Bacillus pseudomycoides]
MAAFLLFFSLAQLVQIPLMESSFHHTQGEGVVTSPKKGTPFTVPEAIRVISPGPKAVTVVWKNPSASVKTVVGETVAAPCIVKETGIPANPMPFTNKRPGATTGTLQSALVNPSPIATSVPVTPSLLMQT